MTSVISITTKGWRAMRAKASGQGRGKLIGSIAALAALSAVVISCATGNVCAASTGSTTTTYYGLSTLDWLIGAIGAVGFILGLWLRNHIAIVGGFILLIVTEFSFTRESEWGEWSIDDWHKPFTYFHFRRCLDVSLSKINGRIAGRARNGCYVDGRYDRASDGASFSRNGDLGAGWDRGFRCGGRSGDRYGGGRRSRGIVGAIVGAAIAAYGVGWLGGGGSDSTTQAEQRAYANDLMNETNDNLQWAHVNAANTGNLIGMDELYFARKAEYAAYNLYENQTQSGAPYVYNAYNVLSQSSVMNGTLAWEWAVAQNYNAAMDPLGSASNYFVGDYSGMNEGLSWNSGLISNAPIQSYQLTNNIVLGDGPGANNQYGYEVVPANGTETLVCTSASGPQSCDFLILDYAGHTLQDMRLDMPADGYLSFKLADFGYHLASMASRWPTFLAAMTLCRIGNCSGYALRASPIPMP